MRRTTSSGPGIRSRPKSIRRNRSAPMPCRLRNPISRRKASVVPGNSMTAVSTWKNWMCPMSNTKPSAAR
ncbi:hypothetical protein EVA_17473 [gut metagenome]|uniref:Uncharacterized protein n=1 Tax=gut metagenome TaxID=749906 RepID=J9FHN6_9ZZZZ